MSAANVPKTEEDIFTDIMMDKFGKHGLNKADVHKLFWKGKINIKRPSLQNFPKTKEDFEKRGGDKWLSKMIETQTESALSRMTYIPSGSGSRMVAAGPALPVVIVVVAALACGVLVYRLNKAFPNAIININQIFKDFFSGPKKLKGSFLTDEEIAKMLKDFAHDTSYTSKLV